MSPYLYREITQLSRDSKTLTLILTCKQLFVSPPFQLFVHTYMYTIVVTVLYVILIRVMLNVYIKLHNY